MIFFIYDDLIGGCCSNNLIKAGMFVCCGNIAVLDHRSNGHSV